MKSVYACGECAFFCSEKAFEKPCQQLGMLESAKGCEKFRPNVKKLTDALNESEGSLDLLSKLVSKIPTSSLHVLSSVMYNEKTTRRYGYKFMQKVYVRYRGTAEANYISNFMPAYILEASKNGLRLMSASGQTHILKTDFKKGELEGPFIYSISEWKKLKASLIKAKKLEDPALNRKKAVLDYLIEDESSTKKTPTEDIKKKKYVVNDLVSMTRDVERGYVVKGSYKRKRRNFDSDSSSTSFTIGA